MTAEGRKAGEPGRRLEGSEESLTRDALLGDPQVQAALKALESEGQGLARDWLQTAPVSGQVAELENGEGQWTWVVAGRSQASRRDPRREAGQWLERERREGGFPPPGVPVILFGLGNPFVLDLLLRDRTVWLYEPDPLLVLAVFRRRDYSRALAGREGKLRLLSPWALSAEEIRGLALLVHPPAQRRAAAHLANLKKVLSEKERNLAALAGQNLNIMVIAPISGGSWPVAASLAEAVEKSGHRLYFLGWDESFRRRESQAHQAGASEAPALIAGLFEQAGQKALLEAASFKPDLVISLAQAPLDTPALARLRAAVEAPLVFWLVEDYRHFGYVAEIAPAYDVFFHIQAGGIEDSLKNWGLQRYAYLPLAADPDLFKPSAEMVPAAYRAELSFMGAGYPNRRRLLAHLAEHYWPASGRPAGDFKIFGSGWEGTAGPLREHLFEKGRRVSSAECALIYAGGRINLNLHSSFRSRPGFEPQSLFVNPRTFEIAAAGSFQIVDERPLLPDLFREGRELAVIGDPAGLPDMIDHYLNRPEEIEAMGRAARKRVLEEHRYENRLESILDFLGWRRGGPLSRRDN